IDNTGRTALHILVYCNTSTTIPNDYFPTKNKLPFTVSFPAILDILLKNKADPLLKYLRYTPRDIIKFRLNTTDTK
ncbi:hypothetical protein, partial [Candidatus Jidaibacter acanthamoebae]|uniref:hypothetical protein n=1 Tax=Candidatus Jidaibacter acanthamoebae TaxID=86105 RepID=UPI00057E2D88